MKKKKQDQRKPISVLKHVKVGDLVKFIYNPNAYQRVANLPKYSVYKPDNLLDADIIEKGLNISPYANEKFYLPDSFMRTLRNKEGIMKIILIWKYPIINQIVTISHNTDVMYCHKVAWDRVRRHHKEFFFIVNIPQTTQFALIPATLLQRNG